MQLGFKIKLTDKLYVRDPEGTELGKQIVEHAIRLMAEMGYEQFTFKKLSAEIKSTEATIYRYFENKHKLLIYILDWYWAFIEFQVMFETNNVQLPSDKIRAIIDVLVWQERPIPQFTEVNEKALYQIAIAEGSKTYLSKEVDENNKEKLYTPYKDLCGRVAGLLKEYNPNYPYPNSLASSMVELSHVQYYFMHHLPRLSDFAEHKNPQDLKAFIAHLVFGALDAS